MKSLDNDLIRKKNGPSYIWEDEPPDNFLAAIADALCADTSIANLNELADECLSRKVTRPVLKEWMDNFREKLEMPDPGPGRRSNDYKKKMEEWWVANGSPTREQILAGCLTDKFIKKASNQKHEEPDSGDMMNPDITKSSEEQIRKRVREEMEMEGWIQMGRLPEIFLKESAPGSTIYDVWTGSNQPEVGEGAWIKQKFETWPIQEANSPDSSLSANAGENSITD